MTPVSKAHDRSPVMRGENHPEIYFVFIDSHLTSAPNPGNNQQDQ